MPHHHGSTVVTSGVAILVTRASNETPATHNTSIIIMFANLTFKIIFNLKIIVAIVITISVIKPIIAIVSILI